MVSAGRLDAFEFCLESNRFAVRLDDSLPFNSQPKLVEEAFTQACTSATICAEDHEYAPMPDTVWLALADDTKSPPGEVQLVELENL